MKIFVVSLLFWILSSFRCSVDAQAATEHSFLRQLAKPTCNDGTCRISCDVCVGEPTSYACQNCGCNCEAGGGDPPPPADCSGIGESCKGSNVCCEGFTCTNLNGNTQICLDSSYTGPDGNLNGPTPTEANTIIKFLCFGDTPYDEECLPEEGEQLFKGEDYQCLQNEILPGVKQLADVADFIVHIGDIKRGSSMFSQYCTDELFTDRANLFAMTEPEIDFLLVPGDNEFSSECDGWTGGTGSGPVKDLWCDKFTTGEFANLDRQDPVWGTPSIFKRLAGNPENFFFYYDHLNIAFFGITEPDGDNEYNSLNANFIDAELNSLDQDPAAIVIFGHSNLETANPLDNVLDTLEASWKLVPILYVMGNDHKYKMDYLAPSRLPKTMELTVEAFKAAPLLVSIVKEGGERYFHVEKQTQLTCTTSYQCLPAL